MEFQSNKGIYLQIADNLCKQILTDKYKADERAPSVRDLAATMEVNRNTVMRSYTHLQEQGILYNKRGIGFFVSAMAKDILQAQNREDFFTTDMPNFISKLQLLQLSNKDIQNIITQIKNYENKL